MKDKVVFKFWKKKKEEEFPGLGEFEKELGAPVPGEAPTGFEEAGIGEMPGLGAAPAEAPAAIPPEAPPPGFEERLAPTKLAVPPPLGPAPAAPPKLEEIPQAAPPKVSEEILAKNIEIISVKLDSIKTTLETINQRLENLERFAGMEKGRYKW